MRCVARPCDWKCKSCASCVVRSFASVLSTHPPFSCFFDYTIPSSCTMAPPRDDESPTVEDPPSFLTEAGKKFKKRPQVVAVANAIGDVIEEQGGPLVPASYHYNMKLYLCTYLFTFKFMLIHMLLTLTHILWGDNYISQWWKRKDRGGDYQSPLYVSFCVWKVYSLVSYSHTAF